MLAVLAVLAVLGVVGAAVRSSFEVFMSSSRWLSMK